MEESYNGGKQKEKTSERLNFAFNDPFSYLIFVINHGFYCVGSFCYALCMVQSTDSVLDKSPFQSCENFLQMRQTQRPTVYHTWLRVDGARESSNCY